jgi:hypothetical protein
MEDYPVEMGMCQFSTKRVMFTWQQTNNPGELFRQEFVFWSQNKYSKGSHYRKLDMSQIWRPREQQMGWSFSVGLSRNRLILDGSNVHDPDSFGQFRL